MKQESASPGKLELRLLGPVTILIDGVLVEERQWTRRKARALLKLLALAPQHQLHREQLIEDLWPEQEPELAANNLNKIIHAARRALEPDLKSGSDSRFILTHDQHVLLRAPGDLWIDVEEFERRAAAALKSKIASEYEAALELYAGELLPEDRYEDWAAARRERLSRLANRLLAESAQLYESAGQFQQSIERFQQLVALHPSNEDAHRHLMRLYAVSGSRHEALAQYQQCQAALRKELDAEPEPQTIALYEQIVAGQLQPAMQNVELPRSANGQVAVAPPEASAAAPIPAMPAPPRRSKRAVLWVVAAVLLCAVIAGAVYVRSRQPTEVEAIAVLPFTNGNADANVEYLSDGITESLINSLSHVPSLRVMARTTAFRYKGREIDPQKIGSELNVQALLTGRVVQRGDELVIQADLIDVKDGAQLWGEQYNRKAADLLAIQADIAREISEKLRLRLTSEEQLLVTKKQTENPAAYHHYLKGRYYWNRRAVPDIQRSIEEFNQAIRLDPNYALAYSGLADAWYVLSGVQLPPNEVIPRARAAAQKALELDSKLAAAHSSLAIVKWRYDWDWEGAAQAFQQAIALDPNYPTAHQWYGLLLTYRGQFAAGLAEMKQAQQLDPLSLIINANLGLSLHFAGQSDAAIAEFKRTLELDQNFALAHRFLGWAYEKQNDYARATAAFQKAAQLDDTPSALAYLGHSYAVAGHQAAAREILQKLQAQAQQRYVSPYYFAVVYVGLKEDAQALEWLAKAADDHSDLMVLLGVEPKFARLRATPQFVELLRRIGLAR
jgi:DNA-binding SARP family transcriptional activator/TolB-like protein